MVQCRDGEARRCEMGGTALSGGRRPHLPLTIAAATAGRVGIKAAAGSPGMRGVTPYRLIRGRKSTEPSRCDG
jgi:hypothetical protein